MSKITLGLGLALLLALAAVAVQTERLKTAKVELQQARAEAKGLVSALESKDGVIGQFEAAAKEAQKIVEDQQKSIDSAAKRVQTLRSQLAESRRQLQLLEEADRDIAACTALLDTSLSVCPGHVRGMLDRASGVQGPYSNGTSAGANADRPASHDGLPASTRPTANPDSR